MLSATALIQLLSPAALLLQQEEVPTASEGMNFMPLMLMLIVLFYFVMIRPENKQRKKREALLAAVKKGDRVMTTGGMLGTVVLVHDDEVTIEAGKNARLRFKRFAIQNILDAEESSTGSEKNGGKESPAVTEKGARTGAAE